MAEVEIPQIPKMNGWQKLMNVQTRINVAKEKNGANGRYKYYTTSDILDEAKPLLKDVGAAVTMVDEIEEHGGKAFLKCTARFIDVDTGAVVTETTGIVEHALNPGMNAAQSTGTTSTYARKRALAGLLLVDGEKDPDEIKPEPVRSPQQSQQAAKPGSVKVVLREKLQAEGIDPEDFARVGYNATFAEIPPQTATEILQAMNQYVKGYRDLKAKAPK